MTDPAILRILDANANRAREGLRVVEEYARFVLESPALAARSKGLRHEFADALAYLTAALPGGACDLEAARDTPGDVGTDLSTPAEAARPNSLAVARAGMKRLQEALRALEEYAKPVSADAGARFERVRYAAYALEPVLFAAQDRRARLARALLYVLVTESLASTDARTAAREAAAGGADIIQMREKDLEDGPFLDRARTLAEAVRGAGALLLVNDRPHLALPAGADGVHTGQDDLPVHLCRRLVGPDRIVGRSTHAPAQLAAVSDQGADYAAVGPVYETATKAHRAAVGLDFVRHAAETASVPWFAIGSVNRETLPRVLDAGARRVAVCTAILRAPDIAAEAAWFKARLAERFE